MLAKSEAAVAAVRRLVVPAHEQRHLRGASVLGHGRDKPLDEAHAIALAALVGPRDQPGQVAATVAVVVLPECNHAAGFVFQRE